MLNIFKTIILIFFFCTSLLFSQQEKINFGAGIGLGSLMGNFPSQTTFGTKIFIEFPLNLKPIDKVQLQYTFAQKFEKFLPGNNSINYFSYMHSFGFSGIFIQPLNDVVNIEEGLGLIYLNDRSYSDINTWDIGLLFNFSGIIPISEKSKISLNLDYGLTFTNTNVNYFLVSVLYKYSI